MSARTQEAYNQVARHPENRRASPEIGIRIVNNWVKAMLQHVLGPLRDAHVLELCGGRGGDLVKYKHNEIATLLFVDNAEMAVHEAMRRYKLCIRGAYTASFVVANCFSKELQEILRTERRLGSFHAVSCQFALHYACVSRKTLRMALTNVVRALRPGGIFFGTIPSGAEIRKRFAVAQKGKTVPVTSVGNAHYRITVENTQVLSEYGFGREYVFQLGDRVPSVPEYFVPFGLLVKEAASLGLRLQLHQTFSSFCQEHISSEKGGALFETMKGDKGMLQQNSDTFEVVGLYEVFSFILDL